jgi:hypothetical protein
MKQVAAFFTEAEALRFTVESGGDYIIERCIFSGRFLVWSMG